MNYIIDNRAILVFSLVLIILFILTITTIFYIIQNQPGNSYINNESSNVEKMNIITDVENKKRNVPYEILHQSSGLIQSYNPINTDIIRQYDIRKAYDPLEDPVRRVSRHEIHPLHLKRLIDIPTRGYPDNFRQIGILVKESKTHNNEDNRILRLFGRQEFPGSNRYEYYTSLSSGNDLIKIPIDVKQQELYDDDVVYIKEIHEHYRVQLHKYDAPKYYPDIIY
jgi:hypothetical protein